jgi:hypothetical protein
VGDYHVLMQFDIDADPDRVRRALTTEEGILSLVDDARRFR